VPTKRKQTLAELEDEARRFDWSRIEAMTDAEIEAAASADPDSHLPSDEELEEAVRDRTKRLRAAKKPAAE
jgi:K+-transporting ATPase c subunit